MADWIKMRAGLLTNPKVTKMARTLLANPEFRDWYGNTEVTETMSHAVTVRHVCVVTRVIVGGLLPVWTAVNESVGRDGHLRHAGLFEIDVMSGIPGFGAAMAAVDWLTELPDGDGLEFANFIEHNTVEQERSTHAKTAAERAKEYRDRKAAEKAAGVTNGVTEKRDASRDTVTTEEKRKEKNIEVSADLLPESEQPTSDFSIPLNDSTEYRVLLRDLNEWGIAFPAVDVAQELRQMRAWVAANPTKRKTRRGVSAFIVRWLSKAQDNPKAARQFTAPADQETFV